MEKVNEEKKKRQVGMTIDLTEEDLQNLWFSVFQLQTAPPDEDGYYHLTLWLDVDEDDV